MTDNVEYTNSINHDVEGDDVTVKLYDANKGKAPRTGGPYLDEVQAREAETWRAKQEDREPDYDNPGPTAATQLVPASQLVERDTDKSHYSDTVPIDNEPVATYVADTTDGFKGEPDPTQPDFDNDTDRVRALEAGLRLEELKTHVEANKPVQAPDPEPTDNDFLVDGDESKRND